jgi:ribonucleoside-diphosphate reductase alpha chain
MPNEATTEDILDAYHQSWVHGLKAMALYRDGSKSSQPLSTKSDSPSAIDASEVEEKIAAAVADARETWQEEQNAAVARAVLEARAQWELEQATTEASASAAATAEPIGNTGSVQLAYLGEQQHPVRRRLPARRKGFTQEARVGGQKVYLRTGEYDDGSLGEIFIDVAKEGAAFRSIINSFAIAVSKGLQYGVPLEEFVDTFTFVRFEPQGMVTGHANIKIATSMIDYVFRALALEYLGRTDLVQIAEAPSTAAEEDADDTSSLFPNWNVTPPAKTDDGPKAEAAAEPVATATPAVPVVQTDPVPYHANGNGNGHYHLNGNGHAKTASATIAQPMSALDQALGQMMGDAPFCDVCGHLTVRNGACYRCLNCGNSLGCS